MTHKYDVVSVCNALVDILVKVDDQELDQLGMTKGVMHLVDSPRQQEVLSQLKHKSSQTELGGSSLNALRSLASLGCQVSFAGSVGRDEFGGLVKDRLDHLGIHPVLKELDEPTGSSLILISPDGERTMNTHLGASRLFDESLIPEEVIKHARILHFCGYQWDTEGQIKAIEKAIQIAKEHSTLVSFDVADPFVVERHQERFLRLIAEDADIVFANKEEAKMLFGGSPSDALAKITESRAIGVIKVGGEGAFIGDGAERFKIEPVATKVVDTTAAGDMFAAGYLYGLINELSHPRSGQIAATLAADVISRVGAHVSKEAFDRARAIGEG